MPTIGDITLSPDGVYWAAVIGTETGTQIQVRKTGGNELVSVTPADTVKVRALQWAGNAHVVATVSRTEIASGLSGSEKREWFQLLAVDLEGNRKWRPLLTRLEGAMNVSAGEPTSVIRDGAPILIVPIISFVANSGVISLAEVRLKSGNERILHVGNPNTQEWLVGPDGHPAARVDYSEEKGRWQLFGRKKDSLTRVYEESALLDKPQLVSFGRDAGTVLVTRRVEGEWNDYELSLADGKMTGPVEELAGDNVVLDRATRTIVGTRRMTLDKVEYTMFSEPDQRLLRALAKAFPGETVTFESWSVDRQTVIVSVEGAKSGASLFLIDRRKGSADMIAPRYEGLLPEQIALQTSFTYKAADGLDIPAYLTLPRDKPEKQLPLIVLAHGGPAARDYPGFDWWAQALASRGYAVLQPQFRGSTGFGEAHRAAGFGQWGRKMQTDLSDGVRHLVAKGVVDAKRVCIVGASYGGYAALAGVTLDAAVYRCGSAVAGVTDLRAMLAQEVRDAGGSRNSTLRYWQRFMGASGAKDTSLDIWSPARLADRVAVPLQLIHGKDDTVVPIAQSRLMRDAMKTAGKAVEYLELAGEDHWLSRPATRIAMLEAQVAFLEKHNPPN